MTRSRRTGRGWRPGSARPLRTAGTPVGITRVGSLLTVFFRDGAPATAEEAFTADRAAYGRFFGAMLDAGVLLAPSQFEAWFVSLAHGEAELDETLAAARTAFRIAAEGPAARHAAGGPAA